MNVKTKQALVTGAQFRVGDVVRLKSGGESMTVESADGATIGCVWLDGTKAQRNFFYPACLEKVVQLTSGHPK